MKPAKCELCGTYHHSHQAHVFASISATNTASITESASNGAPNAATNKVASRKEVMPSVPHDLSGASVSAGVAHPTNARSVADASNNQSRDSERDFREKPETQAALVSAPEAGGTNQGSGRVVLDDGSSDVLEREGAKQRWSREAYNAYQRFLMQARRAVAAGRACAWPR